MQLPWQAELQIAPLWISHLRLPLFMLCISILIFIPFTLQLKGEGRFALIKWIPTVSRAAQSTEHGLLANFKCMHSKKYFFKSFRAHRLPWAQSKSGPSNVSKAVTVSQNSVWFNFQVWGNASDWCSLSLSSTLHLYYCCSHVSTYRMPSTHIWNIKKQDKKKTCCFRLNLIIFWLGFSVGD